MVERALGKGDCKTRGPWLPADGAKLEKSGLSSDLIQVVTCPVPQCTPESVSIQDSSNGEAAVNGCSIAGPIQVCGGQSANVPPLVLVSG